MHENILMHLPYPVAVKAGQSEQEFTSNVYEYCKRMFVQVHYTLV